VAMPEACLYLKNMNWPEWYKADFKTSLFLKIFWCNLVHAL
jgi:hypothetical protein